MRYELTSEEEGTRIKIFVEGKAAVAVRDESGERIYLPEAGSQESSYYIEETSGLTPTGEGYEVFHPAEVREVEVFSR